MHYALCIAEILGITCSFCDPPENAATAVVCRQWSEESLSALWCEVTIEELLGLFGRLEYNRDGNFQFETSPTHESWLRFEKIYQRRIRYISDHLYRSCGKALEHLARIRSSGPLLPNLCALRWFHLGGDDAEYCVMFMNDSVRTFILESTKAYLIQNFGSFLSFVPTRMPHLTSLSIHVTSHMDYIPMILKTIQNLHELTDVKVPAFPDMSLILKGILKGVGAPITCLELDLGFSTLMDLSGVQGDGFNNLTVIRLVSLYNTASQFFRGRCLLKDITVRSSEPSSKEEARDLILQISLTCPHVERVVLSYQYASSKLLEEFQVSPPSILTFEDLQPILSIAGMKCVKLDTFHPPALDDAELEVIAKSWPLLESLSFGSDCVPLVPDRKKTLTLQSLFHISQYCPQMWKLALHLDATQVPGDLEVVVAFTQLERLRVGSSLIDNPVQVAEVLSQILPLDVSLCYGSNWTFALPVDVQECHKLWKEVETSLPGLIKRQIQMKKLRKEIESRKLGIQAEESGI